MTRNVALPYIRVSTNGQADGLGPDLQEQSIRAWAQSHSLRVEHVYFDEGVSGALEDRPALAEAMREMKAGDVLVVARLDRLARDLITQELLLRDIRRRGADVVSCAEGEQTFLAEDPNDPSRKLVRQLLGAIAEYDRAMIALRLRMARSLKRSNGGYAGGEPPFGWRVGENGGLECDQREEAVLNRMTELRESGQTLDEVANILNRDEYRPRRGDRWTKQGVHRILHHASP
jgi:DNA invertase Pin-like site-specific DNA recombinase